MAETLAIKQGGGGGNANILEYAFEYFANPYTYGALATPNAVITTGSSEISGEYLSIKFISGRGWQVTVLKKCSIIRNNVRIDNVEVGTQYMINYIGNSDNGVLAVE